MRKLILALLIGIFSFSFLVLDAEAKRFGGGKSFGMSRQSSSFSRPTPAGSAGTAAAAAAKPASTASKWLGPLAGLAVGGLLASLFMGHGFGTGIMSWLLIGGLIFLVWQFIRSRMQPAVRTTQNMSYQQTHSTSNLGSNNTFNDKPFASANTQSYVNSASSASNAATSNDKPFASLAKSYGSEEVQDQRLAQFNETEFLRHAKSMFIRLQAAFDSKNLADLREFTSPEVFAEIQLQLQERGEASNQTDVVSIDASLLDLTTESHMLVASVEFTGLVREEHGVEPTNVKEIWHFQKFDVRPGWVVAGIQQA